MKAKAKNRNYDSIGLERAALESWQNWYKADTPENRMNMFSRIEELTFAILKMGGWDARYGLPNGEKETAYEYTIYLFERLITKSKLLQSVPVKVKIKDAVSEDDAVKKMAKRNKNNFTFIGVEYSKKTETYLVEVLFEKFALAPYINFNLRHIVFKAKDANTYVGLIEQIEHLMIKSDVESCLDGEKTALSRFSKEQLSGNLMSSLRMFFSVEEIKRLLPISVNFLREGDKSISTAPVPDDIKDFSGVLVSLAKKMFEEDKFLKVSSFKNKNHDEALRNAVNSSVFLASVVNSNFFPKELLLALDMDSLSRLVMIAGGREIKIPSQTDLNTFLGITSAITEVVLGKETEVEGVKTVQKVSIEEAVKHAKGDLDLVFSHKINIKKFIHQALESYDVFGKERESTTVLDMLQVVICSMEKVFDKIVEEADTASVSEMSNVYSALAESATKFTNSLVKISNLSTSKLEKLQ